MRSVELVLGEAIRRVRHFLTNALPERKEDFGFPHTQMRPGMAEMDEMDGMDETELSSFSLTLSPRMGTLLFGRYTGGRCKGAPVSVVFQASRCVQFFGLQGERLTVPAEVPPYCAAAAKTRMGKTVCDRGCGFSFALQAHSQNFQTFDCPFGVSNALLTIRKEPGAAETRTRTENQPAEMFLIAGRMFRSYAQFSAFVNRAIGLDARPDELLENCENLRFENPENLREEIENIAAQQTPPRAPLETEKRPPIPEREENRTPSGPADKPARPDRALSRYAFERRFRIEIERSGRFRHLLSLALIRVNMDNVDGVSAAWKSDIRRLILRTAATRFKMGVRPFDLVAFYEGAKRAEPDEMLALMFPETSRRNASAALHRLLAEVRDQSFPTLMLREEVSRAIAFDVGIAEYPADGGMFREMLEAAKNALAPKPLDCKKGNEALFDPVEAMEQEIGHIAHGFFEPEPEFFQGKDAAR